MTVALRKRRCIILAFVLMNVAAQAQMIPSDSLLTKMLQTDVLLPALIDSAIKNSPEINRLKNSIDLSKENAKVTRNTFFSGLSLVSSYNYGTAGDITVGKENNSTSPFSNVRSTRGDRYNVGVNLQLPLSNLISRKNIARASELQVQIAEDEKDNTILYIKQEVIRLYQEFKLARALFSTSGKSKQVAYVNYTMVQKNFLSGDGELEQLSRMQEAYNKATMEYETSVNRFQTSFLQPQVYTGIQLSNLINQFK